MEKKRLYFICSSIGIFLLSIYSILNINSTRDAMLSSISSYPDVLADRMTSIYSGTGIYLVPSLLCIIFSILIFVIAFKNKLSSYKGFVIGFSVCSCLFGSNSIVSLIGFINIIVAASIKGEKKKDIPILDRFSGNVLGSIFLLVLYFSQMFIPNSSLVFSLLMNVLVLGFCIFIYFKELRDCVKTFFKNFRAYVSYIFPRLGLMYIIYFVLSFICIIVLGLGVSENQLAIESMPIWYTLPLAVLYAPIVEEILFRGCFRKFIKNDVIYIIVSGAIFGLLHTIGQSSLYEVFVMMIPYGVLGGFFAYLYSKTNNICCNMFCHFFHNSIAMIVILISLI